MRLAPALLCSALAAACGGEAVDPVSPTTFQFAPDDAALPSASLRGRTPLLADLDGDADLDLFLSARAEPPWVLANDGSGHFGEVPQPGALPAVDTGDAAAGDVDGDGDLDVVLAALATGRDVLLLNDGGAGLSPAPPGAFAEIDDRTTGIVLLDTDGDGDLDVVTSNWQANGPIPAGLRLLENDGGTFVDRTSERLPPDGTPTFGVTVLDADGDGDADLFAGSDGAAPRLLLGDGAGAFVLAPPGTTPPEARACRSSAAGDVDGDGDQDIVLAATGGARLWLNDGAGRMRDATEELVGGPRGHVERATFVDLDHDRDLDVLLARWSVAQNVLLRNDGSGRLFDYRANLGEPGDGTDAAFAAGDVDGDGDLDLVLSRDGAPPLLLRQGEPQL